MDRRQHLAQQRAPKPHVALQKRRAAPRLSPKLDRPALIVDFGAADAESTRQVNFEQPLSDVFAASANEQRGRRRHGSSKKQQQKQQQKKRGGGSRNSSLTRSPACDFIAQCDPAFHRRMKEEEEQQQSAVAQQPQLLSGRPKSRSGSYIVPRAKRVGGSHRRHRRKGSGLDSSRPVRRRSDGRRRRRRDRRDDDNDDSNNVAKEESTTSSDDDFDPFSTSATITRPRSGTR